MEFDLEFDDDDDDTTCFLALHSVGSCVFFGLCFSGSGKGYDRQRTAKFMARWCVYISGSSTVTRHAAALVVVTENRKTVPSNAPAHVRE
jgi:hypothetical protein